MSLPPPEKWTYGAELEWPDVDVATRLPPGWAWSKTDYSMVNSAGEWRGVANDPQRRLVPVGGELNTPPAPGPDALAEAAAPLWGRMRPGRNYRSNLHIHLRIPGIEDHLPVLERLAAYSRTHLPGLWGRIDPLDALTEDQPEGDAAREAAARRAHSERSRHHFIPAARHEARKAARTLEEFLAAEVPAGRDGRPAWALEAREAVNLRALRKHGTIEFRCFADPAEPSELHAAAAFAGLWVFAALSDGDPAWPVSTWGAHLPRQRPFELELELGWRATNFQHHKRGEVAALLRERCLV